MFTGYKRAKPHRYNVFQQPAEIERNSGPNQGQLRTENFVLVSISNFLGRHLKHRSIQVRAKCLPGGKNREVWTVSSNRHCPHTKKKTIWQWIATRSSKPQSPSRQLFFRIERNLQFVEHAKDERTEAVVEQRVRLVEHDAPDVIRSVDFCRETRKRRVHVVPFDSRTKGGASQDVLPRTVTQLTHSQQFVQNTWCGDEKIHRRFRPQPHDELQQTRVRLTQRLKADRRTAAVSELRGGFGCFLTCVPRPPHTEWILIPNSSANSDATACKQYSSVVIVLPRTISRKKQMILSKIMSAKLETQYSASYMQPKFKFRRHLQILDRPVPWTVEQRHREAYCLPLQDHECSCTGRSSQTLAAGKTTSFHFLKFKHQKLSGVDVNRHTPVL